MPLAAAEEITPEEEKLLQPDIEPVVPERPKKPDPAPAVEEVADVEDDAADEEGARRVVDVGALKKERALRREHEQKAQELEAQIATERRLRATFEQRYAEILQNQQRLATQQQAPQPQPEPEPNKEVDPLGWSNWKLARVEAQLAELAQRSQQAQQAEQQTSAQTQFINQYRALATDFQSKTPDFKQAYDFLAAQLDQDLFHRGVVDPAQRMQILQQEELGMARAAMATGENPAKRLYEYAKFRGFKKTPTVAAQLADGSEAQGQAEGADKLGTLAAGQAAAKSLGAVAGGTSDAPQKYTMKWLSTLNGAAFDKGWKEMKERGKL